MISVLLAAACAMHINKVQAGAEPLQMMRKDTSDIPTGPCALVATPGIPVYSRPIESAEYRIAKLNWGAFPVVDSAPLPPESGWMAIATNIGIETGDPYHSIAFVRADTMTFNVSQSTMSPGDAVETDWSKCTNAPKNW
ncbi:MAG: hypothetical protein UY72_C0077G0012 [Candidatus Uhrbacteria bacterium GW2011_GWD2_52_7]|uniref:Uncharacterized protein n=1 Tax=Candidatus Uhrbacteria bacterium GW2011_GWD2_52_7 TaxID=1618989 RepID=A0A0G1XAK4_9BACT|nr:MAG: hypothetical protein UY72_C0077G0012 [Candidatus Uhrbacteria bacterium GW2011_GWD2_52_7]